MGELTENQGTPYNVNHPIYSFYNNKMQSFPMIRYYFWSRPKKECRIEPGAYADFYFSWTPTVKLTNNFWMETLYKPLDHTIDPSDQKTLFGYGMFKGLNHRFFSVEGRGVTATDTSVPTSGTTVKAAFGQFTVTTDRLIVATLSPLKYQGTYQTSFSDGSTVGVPDLASSTVRAPDTTIPTITTANFA